MCELLLEPGVVEAETSRQAAAAFTIHGYVVVPSALGGKALASAKEAVGALERSLKDLPGEVVSQAFVLDSDTRPLGVDTEERPPGVIFIAGDPARFRPELVDVLTDPLIVGLTQELLGVDEIQCHFTNITTKAPRIGRAISWHRDYPNQYMCPQRSSFLRVMVCLDGMDEGNGGTCFVPGSHLVSDDEAAAMERTTTEPPSSAVEVATCPPGSLVFIHPKVLHGGSRNASERPRRNLIAQWGPADEPVCLYSEAESLTGLRATRDPSQIRRDLAQRRRDRPDPPVLSPARTT